MLICYGYNLNLRIFQVLEEDAPRKKNKVLRKITRSRLKNIALYYLKRFESSVANLRQVLQRRVNDYAYQNKDFDKHEAFAWIEELLEEFQRYGYLDDKRYCEMKVKSYVNAGKSPRYIQGKMREKGIGEDIVADILDGQEYDTFEAALKLARKKRIGPFCTDENARKERRAKDIAALCRAGFDYDVVVRVLDFDVED